jgi:hypothetical protein
MGYKNFNPADKITVDVPLFIRLLEFAREDAKTDMDLHKITENAVALSETGKTLTMDQYDSIIKDSDGEDKPSVINQLDRARLQPAQNQMNENKNKHMKTQLNEIKRMQQLAGLLKENQLNEVSLESKLQQWVDNNAGGYGPDENNEFKKEINNLLYNTLEDFNPENYGDSTSMSPDDILEDFIEEAINIIAKYTMDDYGDSTSFSPNDIKDEFYEFIKL